MASWRIEFILILLVGCMVGGLMNLEDARADDHLPNNWFNQPPLTPRQIKFLKRYPNAQSCLPSSEQAKTNPNLKKFDWSSINNDDHAIVCIFRIAEDLGTPEALGEWLKTFEFNVHGPQQDEQRGTQKNPINLWASRSLDGQWPLYPSWISINRYVSRIFYYGYVIHIRWFSNGSKINIQISYNAL